MTRLNAKNISTAMKRKVRTYDIKLNSSARDAQILNDEAEHRECQHRNEKESQDPRHQPSSLCVMPGFRSQKKRSALGEGEGYFSKCVGWLAELEETVNIEQTGCLTCPQGWVYEFAKAENNLYRRNKRRICCGEICSTKTNSRRRGKEGTYTETTGHSTRPSSASVGRCGSTHMLFQRCYLSTLSFQIQLCIPLLEESLPHARTSVSSFNVSTLRDPNAISFAAQRCYPQLGIPSFPIQLCILILEESLSLHKNLGLFLQCLHSAKSRRGFVCSQSREAIHSQVLSSQARRKHK